MRTIVVSETRKYADSKPHLPIRELIEGGIYSSDILSDYIIDSALQNGFAELVSEPKLETKVIEPESKEKGMKGKKTKKRG